MYALHNLLRGRHQRAEHVCVLCDAITHSIVIYLNTECKKTYSRVFSCGVCVCTAGTPPFDPTEQFAFCTRNEEITSSETRAQTRTQTHHHHNPLHTRVYLDKRVRFPFAMVFIIAKSIPNRLDLDIRRRLPSLCVFCCPHTGNVCAPPELNSYKCCVCVAIVCAVCACVCSQSFL